MRMDVAPELISDSAGKFSKKVSPFFLATSNSPAGDLDKAESGNTPDDEEGNPRDTLDDETTAAGLPKVPAGVPELDATPIEFDATG